LTTSRCAVCVLTVALALAAAPVGADSIYLKSGRIIRAATVRIDGDRVESYDDLYTAVEGKAAGEKVTLSVLRLPGEEVLTIETELIELN
jgi:PDZ domain-containing secreted protein